MLTANCVFADSSNRFAKEAPHPEVDGRVGKIAVAGVLQDSQVYLAGTVQESLGSHGRTEANHFADVTVYTWEEKRRIMMKGMFAVFGTLFSFAVAGGAQSERAETSLTFEVASIKLNTSVSTNRSINHSPGGALNATNVSLRMLITFAYDIRDYQVVNAPAWAGTEGYDINAKPDAGRGSGSAGLFTG